MNTQFHTPSFGDEFVDMQVQQQQMQSKRVRGMDSSLDEYHSATNESFGHASTPLINCSPPAMLTTTAAPATATTPTTTLAARKQLATTATDPNEPAKPLSAYALFFRDTVSAIKQQNPNCSFQELSRIVASMWEALDPTHKNVYQKKNELARNEYLKQLRVYRQQQLETQTARTDEQSHNNPTLQSRPAVFTIARSESSDTAATGNMLNNYVSPMMTSTQHQQQTTMASTTAAQYVQQQSPQQQQFSMPAQQQLFNLNTHQESMGNNISTTIAASVPVAHTPADPSPQQMQMLTEAGSVQKCTRENCNKRAIINPDWEDEYCSNECVVIHCRNVFSGWVESNLEARKQ